MVTGCEKGEGCPSHTEQSTPQSPTSPTSPLTELSPSSGASADTPTENTDAMCTGSSEARLSPTGSEPDLTEDKASTEPEATQNTPPAQSNGDISSNEDELENNNPGEEC